MKKQVLVLQDLLGISSASLCLVHCIVLPLLSVLPFGMVHNHWVDTFFFGIAVVLVFKIFSTNVPFYIKITLLSSLSLVFIGIVIELLFDVATFFVPLGGLGMIAGHLLHYFYHKKH